MIMMPITPPQLIAASVQSEERSAAKKKRKKKKNKQKNLQIGTGYSLKVLMMKWKLKTASGKPDLNLNTLEERKMWELVSMDTKHML